MCNKDNAELDADINIEKKIKSYIEECYVEGKCLAVLSDGGRLARTLHKFEGCFGYSILQLDPDDLLHTQKRRLNEKQCEYIFYSTECSEMVWEILNDGSTLLHDAFLIEE